MTKNLMAFDKAKIALALQFGKFLLERQKKQEIQVVAGYLSYVTLMSLVPLVVVMFSVMTAFPIFSEIRELIENFVYQNFVVLDLEH